jgi:dynein light intermediate chain
LIREVTINCAERGLLLLRVRDEIRMGVAAYQTLYESSIAFGMRKALMSHVKRQDMNARVQSLTSDNSDLESQVKELESRIVSILEKGDRRGVDERTKHEQEVERLRVVNAELKASLEGLLSAPKK